MSELGDGDIENFFEQETMRHATQEYEEAFREKFYEDFAATLDAHGARHIWHPDRDTQDELHLAAIRKRAGWLRYYLQPYTLEPHVDVTMGIRRNEEFIVKHAGEILLDEENGEDPNWLLYRKKKLLADMMIFSFDGQWMSAMSETLHTPPLDLDDQADNRIYEYVKDFHENLESRPFTSLFRAILDRGQVKFTGEADEEAFIQHIYDLQAVIRSAIKKPDEWPTTEAKLVELVGLDILTPEQAEQVRELLRDLHG